ncbi:acyltransferase domain-containing protein [Streptomyces sp. NBC_01142]|uniref:type I polyketide synthase n=1 Tax=Streptomyces sp. NBC_01142 TaxID=2975865 RepID=UPI0022562A29|nr:beta-ketoacyl synthase N-terminal-like domain-containing protein [Streptomyces sp. NBC_01142]MCX4820512.1 acyltransferase domain-containing protein [Streptomyces sp. NBC_01142]
MGRPSGPSGQPVAVVGLDCRFPGAQGPQEYWKLLMSGAHAIGERPASRGGAPAVPGGFLSDADAFDRSFFGVPAAEARAMDPQQRLLLECSWRALEDAGISPTRLAGGGVGTYVGSMSDDWTRLSIAAPDGVTPRTGTGSGRSMLANRIAYQLDLRGPSLTVDTACSSSLVAVHLACAALRAGECDLALAGGVNIILGRVLDEIYAQAGLAAPDGRCKPFSAAADGIGRGEGVGVVALRLLEDAVRDGDRILAVIHGSAVNQDGRSNGIMAPHRASQREVIANACRRAGVAPHDIRFIEAHGTGTPLGDQIEVLSLGDVFRDEQGVRQWPLAIGAVKSMIGHTEGAAGMAGLIKTVLALRHGVVPAGPSCGGENPRLGLSRRSMELITEPLVLPADGCRAGVSSFGMGGTNAHVVVGTAPQTEPPSAEPGPSVGVFTLSADTPTALRRNLRLQAVDVAGRTREELARLCWTSNRSRAALPYRFAIAADGPEELASRLFAGAELATEFPRAAEEPVLAFAFTGQGAQYPRMTAGLYAGSTVYRTFLEEASKALQPYTVTPVHEAILAGDPAVHRTGTTQPALFAVQYALARTLMELGVRPAAVVGHSIGEFAAAVVAEALDLADAARLVAVRAAFMQQLPEGGGMLATRARPAEVAALVAEEPTVGIGALNGPGATVLSGDLAALDRIRARLEERGLACTPLRVSHAFHSPLMTPMLGRFERVAARIPGGRPRLPFHSTVRGRLLAPGEELDAAYWTEHISATVRFEDAVTSLCCLPPTHVVEIGPKPVLGPLIRRIGAARDIPALGVCRNEDSGPRELGELLARLHQDGLDPAWETFYPDAGKRAVRMPAHVFSTEWRSWHQQPNAAAPQPAGPPAGTRAAMVAVPAPDRVRQAVREAVATVRGGRHDELDDTLRFYDDLGFDSVMLMELKYRLEVCFPQVGELSMPEMLSSLVSVESLIGYLSEQLLRLPRAPAEPAKSGPAGRAGPLSQGEAR